MSRLQTVRENWTEITTKLLRDKQELAHFLRFSAKMYKQSFSDAVLIYQQNPSATKVATLETWNKLGRLVNKGEHSIAVFGEDSKCKHLFDVSQTNGKRVPELWKLTEDLSADLTAVINEKYGKDCKNIQETIAAVAVDNIKSRLPDMQYAVGQMKLSEKDITAYQQSIVSAVRFVIANRCELDSDMKISGGINLNAADMFKDSRDLIRFCNIVNQSAKDALLEMEREIVNILKQRRERSNDIQIKPDRTVSSRNPVHAEPQRTGTSEKADRQMGQNVAGVGENGVSHRGSDIHNGGSLEHNSEGNRQRSGETLSGDGRTVPTAESPSDSVQRDTGLGENKSADDRTQDNGGNRVQAQNVVVQSLIDRFLHADFNRRLDSYETAGMVFMDYADTAFDPVQFFDRFHSDRFSDTHAEEIRNIIKAAMQSREYVPEPVSEGEPVIVNNEVVETTELPPLLDQNIINGIMKHDRFFKVKRDEIAEFFKENEDYDKRCEFIKSVFRMEEYTELDVNDVRAGYKAEADGLTVWEGSYLSRTKESKLSWDLVQSFTADLIDKGKYLDEKPKLAVEDVKPSNDLHIRSFSEQDGQIFAEVVQGEKSSVAPVKRTDENIPYIEIGGKPHKLTDIQNYDLEQFEIFRSPVTHDVNGYYADDLAEGDTVKLDGELWTVKSATTYSISLVNDSGEKNIYNSPESKWQETITKAGFEFVPEKALEISEPVFAEPEPFYTQGEQLTFFGEPVPIEQTEKKTRTKPVNIAVSHTAPTTDMINHVLRGGSAEPRSLERIVAQFQKGKSVAENAEFLRKEFGEDGRGYKYAFPDFSSAALVSSWTDNTGITVAISNTAFPEGKNAHLEWSEAAERISEMLENGEYCSQDIIDRAIDNDMKDIAGKLWYLHQDCEVEYFIPDEMFKGGFPDSTERIKASLTDSATLQKYIDGLDDLIRQYEQDRNVLRFHFHKPKELLSRLKDLQLPKRDFITKSDFSYEPKFFVTEDEKDKLLTGGSGVQYGKFRIEKFFKGERTEKEKIAFLKNEYGTGGQGRSGFNEWHDAKGISYKKGSMSTPDCETFLKWNEVSQRIDRLIAEGRYVTQKDIDERIKDAKRTLKYKTPDDDYNRAMIEQAKKVLEEYGVSPDEEPRQSPLQKIIAKAEAEGIPVEITDEPAKERAVFMDNRDETYIEVQQTEGGVEYTIYAPDITPIDGGEWEMEEAMELDEAAAALLQTSTYALTEISDYDRFIEIADRNTEIDVPAELAKLKNEAFSAPLQKAENPKQEEQTETPTVNAPEKITVTKNEPKSGVPYTYHFNANDVVTGGAKSKFKANVEAIQVLQKIEAENRYATPEEQSVMAKYAGWGGIPQAFTTDRAAESLGGNLGEAAPSGWKNEQKQLRELLTPEEYKAARASTLTSFYTPPVVTDGVYQALSQFGFEGGNVLEPSMGVGNFFSKMPENMRDNSRLYGVELDSISGRIAQQLYPKERIQIKGFEQTSFNNNSFDVVVGNIPFGDYRVSDKAYDKHNFKIHDYFAAKSVDKVKPGGVVALVTSKFTMDKLNEKARRYLAERCDLLGAVRLPNTAFKQNAGTEVTTDILFLKKRETMTVEVPDWVHMSETADGIPCNKYFVDNPDMVLGTMAWDDRMKGKYGDDSRVTTCVADESIPLSEQLKAAIAKIEGSIETVRAEEKQRDEADIIPADPSVRNFTHTVVDGKLYFRENEIMTRVAETGKTLDRMMGMHKIRQAAMAVIDAQAAGCSDEELKALQTELNAVYDKFRKAYGNITDSVNERCFRQDDDFNTLAALEIVDTEKKTVEKAEIFSKRTIQPEVTVTKVDTSQEALQVSLDRTGRVDIAYMSQLVGCEPEKLIADLGNDIFRNPAAIKDDEPLSGYEEASEYLSGNVREKLKIAREYAKHIDSGFEKNVAALEKVIPKNLEASKISVRIGANWIDVEDYNRFLKEYAKADTSMFGHPVTRTKMGEYKIEGKYQDHSIAANQTYGTSRMSSYHIFENLLNQRDVVIRDRKEVDGKVYYEVNAKETQLAKEKARQMKEAFKSWVWEDIDRREKYVERYNELFNAIRGREYDGSHQTFPGMNPAIKLRPHQENAVLRGKLGGNTLLAHCVGAGKSFEMIATTMEKKRLGLINKGCVVVPKHLTLQMASEWMRLYPNAKLLVARPEDFTKDNRQKFIARCVTGDYDAVIMSFTQFERIPMSDQYRKQFMERELNEIMDALEEVDDTDRVSVKALERQKRQIEERLEKLLSSKKDNSLCFEKLGFDYLVCDEAHNYKNCFVTTKMSNVAGVQTTAAQKSEDMLMKTQYLNDKYGCNNILFSTGTPVSNSMVEFYVMQRYLRPDLLKKAGLQTFDDWASTFGEVVSQLEIKPAGNGFQMKNRFSKFVNIPELMQMYKEFADIQTPDMIKLPVPKLKTGEPIVVTAKPDDRQKAYMKELAARSEAIHNGNIDPSVDNMLKITHEARLLGLDSRCIFKEAEPTPDSKVMKLLDNLEQNYRDTMEQKGVQIVFCDIAINEDSEHFSVYEAIKADLVKRGIPREEICFAGDAQTDKARAEMFEQLRKGEKRFIIASTSKLGTGANIQDKICAIHHLDIPWKPADLTQQDGRGIRQGNNFDEVGIYHYLTEETFDAYMMGIITNKAKFINQIMTSKDPVRVSEDVDEMVLTYSQMQAIASGNPMIKEKIQLDNDVANLKNLETEHKKMVFSMQELAERKLPQTIDNYADLLQKASGDLKAFQEQHPDNAEFKMEIGGKIFDERADVGEQIEKAIIKCSTTGESVKLGKYFGFDVSIEKNPANGNFFNSGTPCVAVLQGNLKYTSEVSLGNNVGNVRRIENLAGIQINQKIQQLSANLDKAKSDLEEAKANVAKPFGRADELAEKLKRLEYVNAQLSTDKNDDEPIPVSDIPTENEPVQAASVVVAMPVSAYTADKINPKPQTPPVPQNNAPKPVYNKMKR